jgi:hypothetical protein
VPLGISHTRTRSSQAEGSGMGNPPAPRAPGTGHRAPGTGHRAPGTGHRAPGTGIEEITSEAHRISERRPPGHGQGCR